MIKKKDNKNNDQFQTPALTFPAAAVISLTVTFASARLAALMPFLPAATDISIGSGDVSNRGGDECL